MIPEEKLLKLIRGQPRKAAVMNNPATVTVNVPRGKADLRLTLNSFIQKCTSFFRNFKHTDKIIPVFFIISCIYLLIALLYPLVGLNKIRLPKVTGVKVTEPSKEEKLEVKPLESYEQAAAGRQIFNSSGSQAAQVPAGALEADMMKDISLVGVISGDNPQAILEDKKSQKTYYLTEGQSLGEFQIEDIQEGKIILNYRGQRYELYL